MMIFAMIDYNSLNVIQRVIRRAIHNSMICRGIDDSPRLQQVTETSINIRQLLWSNRATNRPQLVYLFIFYFYFFGVCLEATHKTCYY